MGEHFLIDENQLKKIREELGMGHSLKSIARTYNCKISQLKYVLQSDEDKEAYRKRNRERQQVKRKEKLAREDYNARRRERYRRDKEYADSCRESARLYYDLYVKKYK